VGTCNRRGDLFVLKLIPDISPYRNMVLVAAAFDPDRDLGTFGGLRGTPGDLSTLREVQCHHNA